MFFNNNISGGIYPLANIIAEYKFEDNVLDTVGSNDGTATAITYASGLVGKSGVFNGTTSKVVIADADNLSFTNGSNDLPFSLSFIVNLDTVSGSNFLIAKRNTLSEYQLGFVGNELRFRLFGNGGTSEVLAWNHSGFSVLTNYHIVVTYDGSETATTSSLKLYINGTQVTTTTPPNETGTYSGMVNSTQNLQLGNIFSSGFNLDGSLDCVRFWDKELTSAEVSTIATAELAGTDINP